MLQPIRRLAARGIFTALTAICLPLAVEAGTINIIASDMDVTYMGATHGGSLFDAMGGHSGGALAEPTADDISTAVFEVDNVIQGTLINAAGDGDDIHVDLHIDGIGPMITKGVFLPSVGSNGGAFGLDFFTDTGVKVRITTDDVSLLVSNNVFFFTGSGLVYDQSLPFGIAPFSMTIPVQFSFTATLPSVPITPIIASAIGSGALTISGIQVPEPAIAGLLTMGCLSMGVMVRRHRLARRP
ncbi:MAG: PEP-CTERM sorting domain-containing protein [Pirellulales bacterium]